MKHLILIAAFFCFLPAMAQEARFFETLEDIPLMNGLKEVPSETISFDKPEGRIIESLAEIQTPSEQQVSNFYAQSLPAFGWRPAGRNRFFRKNEHLELSFETHQNRKYAKITIRPSL